MEHEDVGLWTLTAQWRTCRHPKGFFIHHDVKTSPQSPQINLDIHKHTQGRNTHRKTCFHHCITVDISITCTVVESRNAKKRKTKLHFLYSWSVHILGVESRMSFSGRAKAVHEIPESVLSPGRLGCVCLKVWRDTTASQWTDTELAGLMVWPTVKTACCVHMFNRPLYPFEVWVLGQKFPWPVIQIVKCSRVIWYWAASCVWLSHLEVFKQSQALS